MQGPSIAPQSNADPAAVLNQCLNVQSTVRPARAVPVKSLRLSVTDRCNLRCRYCMPARTAAPIAPLHSLLLEDLARTTRFLFDHLALKRIRITGGEPLVRPGLPDFIRSLTEVIGVCEVSTTTNGMLLAQLARPLKMSGLARVNVSLDSLDPERFSHITRGGNVAYAIRGVFAALDAGLAPLKLNVVLRRSSWQQDVPELLDFAARLGVEIRFIELMCTGMERDWCVSEYVSARTIQAWLASQDVTISLLDGTTGPARMSSVNWHGTDIKVGWITPRSQPFCFSCDRLRMDSRGYIYRCLMDSRALDVNTMLKEHGEVSTAQLIYRFLQEKRPPIAMNRREPMVTIGG